MAVADIFGANFLTSFWSNYEDKASALFAFEAYFFVASSVLTTEIVERLLQTSLGASVIMGGYGITARGRASDTSGSTRIDGTLGNAAFGGVRAFSIFIAAFLIGTRRLPHSREANLADGLRGCMAQYYSLIFSYFAYANAQRHFGFDRRSISYRVSHRHFWKETRPKKDFGRRDSRILVLIGLFSLLRILLLCARSQTSSFARYH